MFMKRKERKNKNNARRQRRNFKIFLVVYFLKQSHVNWSKQTLFFVIDDDHENEKIWILFLNLLLFIMTKYFGCLFSFYITSQNNHPPTNFNSKNIKLFFSCFLPKNNTVDLWWVSKEFFHYFEIVVTEN